jgi:serine/threonine protein kinase
MIGETAGGYRLVQKLGEGSMGEVFLGEHGQSGQKAAVKVLFPTFSKEGTALTRYFAEVRSTHLFGHPCIAQIYDCGIQAGGRAYLCMEYLPGKSLAAALGDMDNVGEITTLANIGAQVAGALQAVHGKRMVHRALKSDSIFMTSPAPFPVIKLLDFGVANFTQSVRHSQTGSLLGAPLYMSPEVGRGMGNVDHRADIYSLGCILFEMATGRPPFVREGAGQLIVAHATEAAPAARTLEPSLPPELDDLIARCLRKDPAQRPQTMTEVAAALGRFSQSAAPAPAHQATSPQGQAPARFVAPSTPAPVTPRPRRPDPTALLAPSGISEHTPPVALSSRPSSQRNPVVRHQPTALLDPPSNSVAIREAPPNRDSRSAPTQIDVPRFRLLSPPLIAISGVIVLCVLAIVVLLLLKKSPTSDRSHPASSSASAPPRAQFQPPTPELLPSTEAPAAATARPAQAATVRAQPARPSVQPTSHAQSPKPHPSSEKSDANTSTKTAPTKSKPAPLW